MIGSEYKAIYEAANERRKQAEQVASSINRLADLKSHHLYVGLVSMMGDNLAVSMYKGTPDWAPIADEKWGTMIESQSKEVLDLVNNWPVPADTYPVTVDQEIPSPEPAPITYPVTVDQEIPSPEPAPIRRPVFVPTPPAFQMQTWMWWALGIVALGGSIAAIVAFPPIREVRVGRHRGMM